MALINCYECNKEISDKADSCIHCGAPKTNISFTEDEIRKVTVTQDEPIGKKNRDKKIYE